MLVKQISSVWTVSSLVLLVIPGATVEAQVAELSLYALDTDLELAPGLAREAVMSAIEGHIIGEGQVTGIFESEG